MLHISLLFQTSNSGVETRTSYTEIKFHTTTNIDILLLVYVRLQHFRSSLVGVSFVFGARSKESSNRRFVDPHTSTNLNPRPTTIVKTLGSQDLVLTLLSNR